MTGEKENVAATMTQGEPLPSVLTDEEYLSTSLGSALFCETRPIKMSPVSGQVIFPYNFLYDFLKITKTK